MSSEYVRLHGGRLVYASLVSLYESVERLGHVMSIDADGEVHVTDDEQLPDGILYELQSTQISLSYWLAHRRAVGTR